MSVPKKYEGSKAIDDRGSLSFINGFNPFEESIKRFYIVKNHRSGFVRAWHAHEFEKKWVTVTNGAAIIGVVKIDNWVNPNKNADVQRFVLSGDKPEILYIPNGYANGFMPLTDDTKLMFFSDKLVEESVEDDYRFPAHYWDPWKVEER